MKGRDSRKKDVVRDLFSADMLKLLSAEPKCHLGPCSTMLMFSLDVKIAWWLCRASTGDCTVNIQPMGNRHSENQEELQHNLFITFMLKKDSLAFHKNLFTKNFVPSATELIKSRILQAKESAGVLSVSPDRLSIFITKIKLTCTSLLFAAEAGRKMRKHHLKP